MTISNQSTNLMRKHNTSIRACMVLALLPVSALADQNLTAVPYSLENGHPSLSRMTPEEEKISWAMTSGWTSKYVTEGIDCLPGSAIWEVAPSVAWKNWNLSAWYASGVSETYEELDVVLSYTFKQGNWTFTPWYEHQFYFTPKYNVANPAFTTSYAINEWLSVGADAQWKVEHQRLEGYYDVFVQAEWKPFEKLTIAPLIRFGYNSGYNVQVDQGANCIDYSCKVSYVLSEICSLSAVASYSQAATVLRRASEGNEFAYGFYLNLKF